MAGATVTGSESLFPARCADFPDVAAADAVALEIALREIVDDDAAVDAAILVLRLGWRRRSLRDEYDRILRVQREAAFLVEELRRRRDRVPTQRLNLPTLRAALDEVDGR